MKKEKTITPVLTIIYQLQSGIEQVKKSKTWTKKEKEIVISTISFILNNIHQDDLLGKELQCFKNAIDLGFKQAMEQKLLSK